MSEDGSTVGLEQSTLEDLPDRVSATFAGKTVLVTGGTGFVGKVLLEKMLRKCPNIGGIIVLIRPKKGKDTMQRLQEIFQGPLFASVVALRGMQHLLSVTKAICADISAADLALSPRDREICLAANIIVHSAASVRFDENLKKIVYLNTRGTHLMLQLAKECTKLELFIYVSTAYCHPEEKLLGERFYPPPADPHQVISTVEIMDEEIIDAVTDKFIKPWPNTYAFTKALSEALVEEQFNKLPIIMMRPSVVIPVYKEPIPGWTDNINGPPGLLIAAGKGVLRTMYGDDHCYADFVPVDMFVNSIMIFTWNYLHNGDRSRRVINLTSSAEIKVSWDNMLQIGKRIALNRLPLNNVAWYPGGGMTNIRWWHNIRLALYHWLPAIFVDALLFCLGFKPVLMRVQQRISKGLEVFEYYTSHQWDFISDNLQTVRKLLNQKEKIEYKVDAEGFNLDEYFENCTLGTRRYILKETDDTLPAARRHLTIMWCVDLMVKTIFWGLMMYWIYSWIFTSSNDTVLSVTDNTHIDM